METKEFIKKLYQESGNEILRVCFLYLKDFHLAEDALQETFIKALEKADTFKEKSSLKTWVMRIAINVSKNMLRKRKHIKEDALLSEGKDLSNEGKYEDVYEQMVEKSMFSKVIMGLSQKDREIILLYYYQQFSQKEIAQILRIRTGAVSQRIRRAKENLRKALKEAGYGENDI